MLDGLFIHCPWVAAARPARVFSFAPRIKNIGKQRLYVFRGHNRRDRGSWKVTPDNYINDALVRGNRDDLLRLVTTIKLKENTASDIFRRLNSYSRQHALYQTLKAFGQIIKSIFILRYIDDLELYGKPSQNNSTRSSWPTASHAPWLSATPVSSRKPKRKSRK